MDLKKVRDLAIAKNTYNYLSDINQDIDHLEWMNFVNNHSDIFTWAEDTSEGKKKLSNIEKVPESFRERVLVAHNKNRCFTDFDVKRNSYNIGVTYYGQKIGVSFERPPKQEDLKIFLDMAKCVNALLLIDGNFIIDDNFIDSL